jgi:hypothetical protein
MGIGAGRPGRIGTRSGSRDPTLGSRGRSRGAAGLCWPHPAGSGCSEERREVHDPWRQIRLWGHDPGRALGHVSGRIGGPQHPRADEIDRRSFHGWTHRTVPPGVGAVTGRASREVDSASTLRAADGGLGRGWRLRRRPGIGRSSRACPRASRWGHRRSHHGTPPSRRRFAGPGRIRPAGRARARHGPDDSHRDRDAPDHRPRRHGCPFISAMWWDACRSFRPTYTMPAALRASPSQKNSVWYCATSATTPVAPSTGTTLAR